MKQDQRCRWEAASPHLACRALRQCDLMQGVGQARWRLSPGACQHREARAEEDSVKAPRKGREAVWEGKSEWRPGGQGRQYVYKEDASSFVRCCWGRGEGR